MAEENVSQETQEAQAKPEEEKTPASELDRAEAANKEKRELIEREEKLQARKEKLHSIQMVGGRAEAGSEPEVKEETPKEYAQRVMKNEIENP